MLGITGYLCNYPSPADLATFMRIHRSDGNIHLRTGQRWGSGPTHPHLEAILDIQYAEAMGCPTQIIFYSTGRWPSGTDDSDWLFTWLGYTMFALLGARGVGMRGQRRRPRGPRGGSSTQFIPLFPAT
ncbi:hypothetical protein BJY52DRAFT_1274044 [Lactarius psammicola]|nr:hypothetical protein BJY52DRAFT_1274044 [Lactarius psammicola]